METRIKTVHEEQSSDGKRTFGVLLNYPHENEIGLIAEGWKDSFIYLFKSDRYIFFDTIIDMIDYELYGDMGKVRRAYMSEEEFDAYYDSHHIDGTFTEKLKWQ
ncbi:MAG: hypothetical protein WC333_00475 [Dehalococcoidia bacterium]|jgi:hypothetical protein